MRRLLARFEEAPPGLVRAPGLLAPAALLRLAVFALDAGTLATVLRALGQPAPLTAAFAAFIVGSVAATVGPLPGGLGTFEVGVVTTLGLLGTATAAALAATLLLRGMTLWGPLLPGLLVARHELRASPPAGRPEASPPTPNAA